MLERFRALSHTLLGPIARLLIRLGVSPDLVTIIGTLGVAVAALVCFPQGWLWQGDSSSPFSSSPTWSTG